MEPEKREMLWALFCAAAMANPNNHDYPPNRADKALAEFDKRFPDKPAKGK